MFSYYIDNMLVRGLNHRVFVSERLDHRNVYAFRVHPC